LCIFVTDLPYYAVFDRNVLRFSFVRTIFYNKINCVRVVIEIGELSKIFVVSHMESLPLKRECAKKEYIKMC